MATATKPLNTYYASLLESFNIVATAATKAHERATRLTSLAGSEVADAQRDGIAFAKEFATDKVEPTAILPRYKDATAKAQNHVASYAKTTLQEALDAAAEYRETAQKLFDTNKKLAEAFAEVVGEYANGQAFADAIQAFTPAAPKVKAESK
jgi:hypothetical protein